MVRRFKLRPMPGEQVSDSESPKLIDRREFMRHSFNTAAGVITMASLGVVGFASLLMGQADSDGGDSSCLLYTSDAADE